jgi:hypothetical protein
MMDRARYLKKLEDLSAQGLSNQNVWTLFRNRVARDWVWTARTAGLPEEAAKELDDQVRTFFVRHFVTGTMTGAADRRIFHPVRDGGMGIPNLQRAAPAANAASWAAAQEEILKMTNTATAEELMTPNTTLAKILEGTRALCAEAAQHSAPAPMAQPRPFKPTQKALQNIAVKSEMQSFFADSIVQVIEKAWARSCGGPGAGAFLLPAMHPTHVIPGKQFTLAISLRVGADILRTGETDELLNQGMLRCPFVKKGGAVCGAHVDPKGHNLLGDTNGGGVCERHDDLQLALKGLINDEGLQAEEEQVLTTAGGVLLGRADVSWTGESMVTIHVYVSVVMATCQTAISKGSAVKDEVAAMEMEEVKIRKYALSRLKVTPAIMEEGGRFGPLFVKLLDTQKLTAAYQTLTATIARANANIIMKAAATWAA